MRRLTKYAASFKLGLASAMEYRFDFFMGLLSTVFPIILQVFLWMALYRGSGSAVMYGHTYPQMMLYVVLAGAVGKFTSTGIEFVVNEDVHTGGIAKYVTKPISYVFFRLCGVVGQKCPAMATMAFLSAAAVVALRFLAGFRVDAVSALLFVPSLALAVALNFCIFFCISTLSFWLTEIGYFFHAINITILVLSGGVFPIDVFGSAFVAVAKYIPLAYTVNYPIQILSGAVSAQNAAGILLMQLAWVAALTLLSQALWKRGIRQYVAVGG